MIKRMLLMVGLAMSMTTSVAAQTWKPGRQLMIWPRPDTVALGDTLVYIGLARTVAGATVSAPRVYWTATTNVTAREVAGNALSIVPVDTGRVRLIAEWRTSTTTHRDTVWATVRYRPFQWKVGQRLLLVATDTTIRQRGDQVAIRVYARTASGVAVTSPGIIWTVDNMNDLIVDNTTPLLTKLIGRADTLSGSHTWVRAEWATSTATFRDSIFITTRKNP